MAADPEIPADSIQAYIDFQLKLNDLQQRGVNPKEVSIEEKSKRERRKEQTRAAKNFMLETVRNQKRAHDYPLKALEKTQEITQSTINQELENIGKTASKVINDSQS